MSNSRKRWTTNEHNTLESTIKDALSKGEKLSRAYRVAAFKTGRSVEACKWRWKNVVKASKNVAQTIKSNLKVAQFKARGNRQFINQPSTQPVKIETMSVNKLLEDLFGPLFGTMPNNWFTLQQTKKATNTKDMDISNLSAYPMYNSTDDYCVIDEETKMAYIVAILGEDANFCSCQKSPFDNANCRHVRKIRFEKN